MRVRSLDSLRGVAALVVVLDHCWCCVNPPLWDKAHWKINLGMIVWKFPLFNGSGAVLVFFVLSGLVLALSFTNNDNQKYAPYLVKRVSRIWLPLIAALILSSALQLWLQPHYSSRLNVMQNEFWSVPLSWRVFFGHAILLTGTWVELDHPIWSLVHEMRISLIFPAIVFAVQRRPWIAIGCSVAALVPARLLGHTHGESASQFADTLSYLFLFVIGAAAGLRLQAVQNVFARCNGFIPLILWLLAFGLLALCPSANLGVSGTRQTLFLCLAGVGACIIVGLCTTESPVTRALERPLPMWLGRISYSLYLIHFPILIAMVRLMPHVPLVLICGLGVSLSLCAAHALNLLIERPAQKLGRSIARMFGDDGFSKALIEQPGA